MNKTDPTGMVGPLAAVPLAIPAVEAVGAAVATAIRACAGNQACRQAVIQSAKALLGPTISPVEDHNSSGKQSADELLAISDGKISGNLPDPGDIDPDDRPEAIDRLEKSITERIKKVNEHGELRTGGSGKAKRRQRQRDGHIERIRRERELLNALRKAEERAKQRLGDGIIFFRN